MTEEEVLAAALSDPDAQPLDPEALAKMRRVSPVKVLRRRLGMTFCWHRGRTCTWLHLLVR
jgi:putative transcriptional regulator